MKKILFICFSLFVLLVGVSAVPLAATELLPVSPPEFGFGSYFVSLASLAILVGLITQALNMKFQLRGILPQLLSWLVSIVLCLIGWQFNLGIFEGITDLFQIALYSLIVTFGANGGYDLIVNMKLLVDRYFPRE